MRLVFAAFTRLRRCHWFTWCVVLLATVVMTLIVVPSGSEPDRWDPSIPPRNAWDRLCQVVHNESVQLIADETGARLYTSSVGQSFTLGSRDPELYNHGWPSPFLVRTLPDQPNGQNAVPAIGLAATSRPPSPPSFWELLPWAHAKSWPFHAIAWRVDTGNLAFDLTIALGVILGSGALVEWWIRSRGGLLRFRLVDLLGGFTLCALILGWWVYHAQVERRELAVEAMLTHGSSLNEGWIVRSHTRPVWLAKLVGDQRSLSRLRHITGATYYFESTWRDDIEQICRLPYLESLALYGEVPREAIAMLQSSGRLRKLELELYPNAGLQLLESREQLLRPECLEDLAVLHLDEIRIACDGLAASDLERLLQAAELKVVGLGRSAIDATECERLHQRYPNVQLESSAGYWVRAAN